MDVERLKNVLNRYLVIENETTKDIICHCPLCGDHPNPNKRGHLYVSKRIEYPFVNCFLCQQKMTVKKFLKLITGSNTTSDLIITKEELDNALKDKRVESSKRLNFKTLQIPILDTEKFPLKTKYLEKRTNNCLDIKTIPNIIFDYKEFLNLNKIVLSHEETEYIDFCHDNMVIFLSHNNTRLFMRNIDKNHYMKMKKVVLQEMPYDILDYYCIKTPNVNSNIIVLSEGNFDILGEYAIDSLSLRNKALLYAAGQSFSYSSLLKAISFNECLFQSEIVILSDSDKQEYHYNKFLKENSDLFKSVKFFYNKNNGGDFGSFPIVPFEVKIQNYKDRIKY